MSARRRRPRVVHGEETIAPAGHRLDEDGIRPDALAEACCTGQPAALDCMPSFQNPTAAHMPETRRMEVAAVASEHNLTVIEDDVYGYLAPEFRPLSNFLPESQFFYITSTSKSIAPGIRIGYLLAPSSMIERLSVAVLRTTVNAPRQDITVRVLGGLSMQTHPQSPHIWVKLPEPWRSEAFVARARNRGILLTGAESFAVGHETDVQAIRIALGPPATRSALEEGLTELVRMVHHVPDAYELVV